MKRYPITPMGKPRMTQRDKWYKRNAAQRYWAFKAECRLRKVEVPPNGAHITFVLPVPKSWPKHKKREMVGQPHLQKPDKDNLEKALLDAVYDDDSVVWDSRVTKIWGWEGEIIVDAIE